MRVSRAALIALTLFIASCGSDGGGPTGPGNNTPTRVIHLEGALSFDDVIVGQSADRDLRISNRGTDTLTVTGMTAPGAGSGVFSSSFTNGTIAPGATQTARIRFTPSAVQTYSGVLTVQANHTEGTNTIPISGTGRPNREPFTRSGVGNTVFDMPSGITRVRITGRFDGSCENFIMRIGGRLVVNEILGTCSVASGRTYEGTHLVSGTVVEVTGSNGVSWSIQEIQ